MGFSKFSRSLRVLFRCLVLIKSNNNNNYRRKSLYFKIKINNNYYSSSKKLCIILTKVEVNCRRKEIGAEVIRRIIVYNKYNKYNSFCLLKKGLPNNNNNNYNNNNNNSFWAVRRKGIMFIKFRGRNSSIWNRLMKSCCSIKRICRNNWLIRSFRTIIRSIYLFKFKKL